MSAIAKNGIIYQGGTPVIDILNSDLQALIQAGTYDPNVLYNITDLNDNENIIDDENVSNNTTWSSSKINSTLGQKSEASAVSGDTAFAKINSLNNSLVSLAEDWFVPEKSIPTGYMASGGISYYAPWICFYVPVWVGTTYILEDLTVNSSVYICELDGSFNRLTHQVAQTSNTITFTTSNDARYISVNVLKRNKKPKIRIANN